MSFWCIFLEGLSSAARLGPSAFLLQYYQMLEGRNEEEEPPRRPPVPACRSQYMPLPRSDHDSINRRIRVPPATHRGIYSVEHTSLELRRGVEIRQLLAAKSKRHGAILCGVSPPADECAISAASTVTAMAVREACSPDIVGGHAPISPSSGGGSSSSSSQVARCDAGGNVRSAAASSTVSGDDVHGTVPAGDEMDGGASIGQRQAGEVISPQRKYSSVSEVLIAAARKQRASDSVFHEDQHHAELDAELGRRHWLSNSLMYRAVLQRSGPSSWEARLVRWLQSRLVQVVLIALLLGDVFVVFAELYLETEHPGCRVIRQNAYSCCAAPEPATHVDVGALVNMSSAVASARRHHRLQQRDAHAPSGHGASGPFWAQLIALLPHSPQKQHECAALTVGVSIDDGGAAVGCAPASWVHVTHELFSFTSLLILLAFQLEIFGFIAAFRTLFVRSAGYLLDVVVVSLSLALQWYVLMIELGFKDPLGLAASADEVSSLEELQGIILFARLWRFIRVGHGIASSVHDIVHQSHAKTHEVVRGLRESLRHLDLEIAPGDVRARKSLHEVNEGLKKLMRH
jgi:hypothetical protein